MTYLLLLVAQRRDLETELAEIEADLSTELPSYVQDALEKKEAEILKQIKQIDHDLKYVHTEEDSIDLESIWRK